MVMKSPCSGPICMPEMRPSVAVSSIKERWTSSGAALCSRMYSCSSGVTAMDERFTRGRLWDAQRECGVALRESEDRGGVEVGVVVAEEPTGHVVVGLHRTRGAQVARGGRSCVVDVARIGDAVTVAVARVAAPRRRDDLHGADRTV